VNRAIFSKYVLPVAAALLLLFAIGFVVKSRQTTEPQPPPVAPPTSQFQRNVAAAGIVESQTENIAVGAPLPGIVVEVLVNEGDKVFKDKGVILRNGQEIKAEALFRLDDRQLRSELSLRKSALASAQAELTRLLNLPRPEELAVRDTQVKQAIVARDEKKANFGRLERLFANGTITEEAYLEAKFALESAEAQLERTKAERDLLKAGSSHDEKEVAKAAVAQAEAQVKLTETELQRLKVRPLVDGEVLQVNVRPGEFVAAPPGQPLIMLGNTETLHVRVDIDENDIPRYSPGKPAMASPKGRPMQKTKLHFVRVQPFVVPKRSLTGQNIERVDTRVLQVIYAMEGKSPAFYVGQQVDVFIDVGE
jgi:HlyD family secretion protein